MQFSDARVARWFLAERSVAPGRGRRLMAACLLGGATACSGESGEGAARASASDPVVRDSAGIRIIENAVDAPDSTSWWIDTVAALRIGDDEGRGEAYLFGSVSATAWLADGSVVVADAMASEVRVYDRSGTFVRRIGRRGEGPGEFNRPRQLHVLPGDTVVVQSSYLGYGVPYFAPDGAFTRNWSRPEALPEEPDGVALGEPESPRAFFTDGSALVAVRFIETEWREAAAAAPRTPVPVRERHRLLGTDPDGRIRVDYGDHPASRALYYHSGDVRQPGIRLPWWRPQPAYAVHGRDLYLSSGERFEILLYDEQGHLARIIRKSHDPVEVPRAVADSVWRQMFVGAPAEVAWLAEVPRPPLPEAAPALDFLIVDAAGNLWARSNPPGQAAPPRWFVFDSAGVLRHSLRTDLEPARIGEDAVLAVVRDHLGVQHVAVFPLRKR